VFCKTLRNSLWLVLVLTVLSPAVWSRVPDGEESQVTASIHNDAGISPGVLLQAESDASRVFRQSAIEVHWLNCPLLAAGPENPSQCEAADFPNHLQLRIVKQSLNLNEFALGISFLSADGTGCYADLFYDRAKHLHETTNASLPTLLGHAIAHELGHLLLGTNSHSPTGIMRARWRPADLADANRGRLLFSSIESQQMRNTLTTWHSRGKKDSPIEAARTGD
jgi:hypothetical protein